MAIKVLVLGASGMLGNAVYRNFQERPDIELTGVLRSNKARRTLRESATARLIIDPNFTSNEVLRTIMDSVAPDEIINCVGYVKQRVQKNSSLEQIFLNSFFPHQLSELAFGVGARLCHVSTDCVFSGEKGGYAETDRPDPLDFYGATKWVGEISGERNLTLRTSIIGHELKNRSGLLEWFLSQRGEVDGFTNAIFSGVTTLEFSELYYQLITKHQRLMGLFHVASEPISKFDLLSLIKDIYAVDVDLTPNGKIRIDRSLNGSLLKSITGYSHPNWSDAIRAMYANHQISLEK